MKLLLNDEFAPITRKIGFVQANCANVAKAYLDWVSNAITQKYTVYSQQQVTGNIQDVLLSLLPLQQYPQRILFVPTVGHWTACFENGWKGTDVPSIVSPLAASKRMNCPTVSVMAVPRTIRGEKKEFGAWGSMSLTLFTPDATELRRVKRSVGLVNDYNGWKFHTVGEPLPFERVDMYTVKGVKARFPEALFHEYLAALNLFPFDAEFYMPADKGPAILIDSTHPNGKVKTYSLEDVKQYI
jgi:hypothetical protein